MKKVMAQGTFDVIHPGHIKYLEKSAEKGDKLTAVIARDSRVKDRKQLAFNEEERKKIIESLEAVDKECRSRRDQGIHRALLIRYQIRFTTI